MTDKQMKAVNARFDEMRQQFGDMREQFKSIDRRFDAVDRRFDAVDRRLDGVDTRLNGLDEAVNRQGVLLENNTQELRLVAESVHTLQKVMNIKFDDLHERLDQRLVPLELAVKHHTERLNERQ